ncbi:MAG: hypothetical protein ABI963_14655 [Rhizomicrobium sp.]
MSGILFLASIIGFVVIAYWAFKNDAMGLNENGSGLLAMRSATGSAKSKSAPKWKKEPGTVIESPRRLERMKAAGQKKTRWNRALPGRGR